MDRTVANCGKLWQNCGKLWQNYNPDTVFVGEMKGNVHANWLLRFRGFWNLRPFAKTGLWTGLSCGTIAVRHT